MSPRGPRRPEQGGKGGEAPEPNRFEAARGVVNNVLSADSYNGAQLTTAVNGLVLQVGDGIAPGDNAARLGRYTLVDTVLGQAADKAAGNADELTASTFRAHRESFQLVADILRSSEPASLPDSSAMKGAKANRG